MIQLRLLTQTEKKKLINKRAGETKFGEHIKLLSNINNIYEELNELDELQIQLRADWISSGLTGSAAQCLH